jgi:hypothetical protein
VSLDPAIGGSPLREDVCGGRAFGIRGQSRARRVRRSGHRAPGARSKPDSSDRALRVFATRPTACRSHPSTFVIPSRNAAIVIPNRSAAIVIPNRNAAIVIPNRIAAFVIPSRRRGISAPRSAEILRVRSG